MNPLLISLGGKLIEKFIPDEKAQAQAKVELIAAEQKGELAHLDAQMQIMLAEAKSSDPFVSRARPTFMYVFYTILIFNAVILPFIGIWATDAMTTYYANLKVGLEAIPSDLWLLFGAAFTGYTFSRSYDKSQIMKGKKTMKESIFDRFK